MIPSSFEIKILAKCVIHDTLGSKGLISSTLKDFNVGYLLKEKLLVIRQSNLLQLVVRRLNLWVLNLPHSVHKLVQNAHNNLFLFFSPNDCRGPYNNLWCPPCGWPGPRHPRLWQHMQQCC